MTGFGETVGGWFGSSMVGKMLDMLGTNLGNNHALQNGTAEMLTSLEQSLSQIRCAIVEARKIPAKNPDLIKWLDILTNAAYEVRDVLDDFEAKKNSERLKGKNKITESGKFVRTLFLPDKELLELKSILEKINKIPGEFKDFRDRLPNEYSTTHKRDTSSYLDPNSKIFGRDVEIYFILDMILNYQLMCFSKENSEPGSQPNPQREIYSSSFGGSGQESKGKRKRSPGTTSEVGKESMKLKKPVLIRNWKLPVLPICGLGGMGKTTIAQIVYNNDIVKEVFDQRAWVYVSEKFDVTTIMKKIIDLLGDSSSSSSSHRELIERKLIKTIENRRFFLVLDDIHDGIESKWSDLFSVLSNGAVGSFILLTTQSECVAKRIGNMSIIINLDALELEWFDLLFKSYAFGELFNYDRESGSSSITCKNNAPKAQVNNLTEDKLSDLECIATKIGEKLHGLPLAGRVIGKMLYNKLDKGHWGKTLKNNLWDDESTCEEILVSLSIGYKDLDPDVQQCFKFCAIFPKHYVFDRNTLVQMWLAHDFDFVQPKGGESFKLNTKEIKLEDIGGQRFDKLVERSFFQTTFHDGKYVMHDLIRELAIAVSRKEEFFYVNGLDNKISNVITRHVGMNCDGSNQEEISPICTNLRTMVLFGNWIKYSGESISNIFGKSNSLRLLDLSYIGIKGNACLDAICRQSHLRFVDLSFSGIDFIPDTFCELYHLQVLDVQGCEFRKLPTRMNKLINLRYLYASAETLSLISGIGELTNLQELKEFRIGDSNGHKISELRDMNEISGHLLLTNLQNVTNQEDAATCQLGKKRYLKSLELTFSNKMDGRLGLEVLQPLKPSPSVEMLTIRGGGDSLPGWVWSTQSGFSNLKCIEVIDFSLTTLPAFGELPSLEVLRFTGLYDLEMVGDEFYGRFDVVFPSLKELQFSGMAILRTWSDAPAEKKSFLVLKKILLNCNALMEMPTKIFTSSVVELELSVCFKTNNIERILQRMPYLTHLSIATYYDDLSIDCTVMRFLEVLCLVDVKRLFFVGGLMCLVNLRKLRIEGFNEIRELFVVGPNIEQTCQQNRFLTSLHLDHRSHSTQNLPIAGSLGYLRSLLIRKSPVIEYTEEEGRWFSQLTSLETLEFSGCSKLRGLPSTLPMLTKLKKLTIAGCHKISSLPESGLPRSLTELYITECSDELLRRCQPEPDEGDDWWKISHIPHILIKERPWRPHILIKERPWRSYIF
ncbi:Disease resistance protein RGA2 [Rhynchospora pubera]|uniref:Disease resistance protein RGA2 n=1 Tax=Rhynchospora pubera TaxID=906938 RepID=A0AAV8CYV2_9POAL|nr:Disease resistance protein RGA2 [Rhynchospora pubera]